MRHGLFVAVVVLAAACGSPKPAAPTWEADVQPLVKERCGSCHVEGGVAPFPLTTYEQTLLMGPAMRAAIEDKRMPPYLAGAGCNEFADDQRLSDEQIAMVGKWVDAEMPRGKASSTQMQSVDTPVKGLARVDLSLQMPVKYTPAKSPDDYRCFVLDWPRQNSAYVVGLQVRPGNKKTVHHVIAFVAPPSTLSKVAALEAKDPEPGYQCFGGPGFSGNGWLGAWAPGGEGTMYAADTGIKVEAGSKIILQLHYNTASAPPGEREDATSLDLALADTVKYPAAIVPWANPDWIRNETMKIPAFAKETTHAFEMDPTPYLGLVAAGQIPSGEAIRIYSASLHQHTLGTRGRTEIIRADGTKECLLDIPRWNFHWQRSYPFTKPKVLRPGDKLALNCSWDNSVEAQQTIDGVKQMPREVNWGEGTFDEMCLGVFYISK